MSGWFVEESSSSTGLDNCLHFRASFTSDVLRVFHSLSRTSDGKIVILYRIIQYEVFKVHYSARYFLPSGDGGIRTLDPLLARQVLSQLSYTPIMGFHWIFNFTQWA